MLKKLIFIILFCGQMDAMENKQIGDSQFGFVLMDACELDKTFDIKQNGFGELIIKKKNKKNKVKIDINTHTEIINTFALPTFQGAQIESFVCHDRQSKINFALFEKTEKKTKDRTYTYVSFTFEKEKINQFIKKNMDVKPKILFFETIKAENEELEFAQKIMADLQNDREGTLRRLQAATQLAKMQFSQMSLHSDNPHQAT